MPAGFPSTENLTTSILNGHGVYRGSDSSYHIKPKKKETLPGILNHPDIITVDLGEIHKEREELPKLMANWFYKKAKRYYSAREWFKGRKITYEDIFYLVQQARADEWETENPAIHLFINETRRYIRSISDGLYSNEYFMILSETYNYIEDVIREKLSRPSDGASPRIIESICKEFNISCIVTLSHDVHLEKFLGSQGILLADGFSDDTSSVVRHWNGDFSSRKNKIPFLKVHGSISWFENLKTSEIVMLHNTQQIDYSVIDDFFRGVGARPNMLIGTFNKISEYTRGMFLDIYYNFRCKMNKADTMIICGYSFGDKAINGEIIYWYGNKPGRRFVIIHHCPKRLIENARPAIQRLLGEKYHMTGRPGIAFESTRYIHKKLQHVTIDDIHDAIAS